LNSQQALVINLIQDVTALGLQEILSEQTNSVAPCLKVAPSGEQVSPFLIVAAQVEVIPTCKADTTRQVTINLGKNR